ncbi:MAG: hypothetical protein NVS9B4_26090 [Candidatus Acidiferrum sp.]
MNSYRVYGLTIDSDLIIPGLNPDPLFPTRSTRPSDGRVDIKLQLGKEPAWADSARDLSAHCYYRDAAKSGPASRVNDGGFVVTAFGHAEVFEPAYPDGARFMVDSAGEKICACWKQPLTIEDVTTYLLGPVMGFVLRRRGVMALHASSVSIEGRAIVFSGAAGTGKSTTAAALALRGVPVLCEDIAALQRDGREFVVAPGYPRVCLWPEAVSNLLGSSDALRQLTPNWEKRFLELDGKRASFAPEAKRLGAIYFFAPRVDDPRAPRVEELSSREALIELVQNTYMNWLIDGQQRRQEFDILSEIVSRIPVRRIVPHGDPARIGVLCDLIVASARQLIGEAPTIVPASHH